MLDDDAGGTVGEFRRQLEGGVGVIEVVVAQLLALNLFGGGDAGPVFGIAIERRLLVRILAVTQGLFQGAADGELGWEGVAHLSGKPARDGGVIGAGAGIGPGRQGLAECRRRRIVAAFHFFDQLAVIGGIDDDGDESMVLGRRPDQGRAADIDVLDTIVEPGAAGNRRLERIQIDHQQPDGPDAVIFHRLLMRVHIKPGQKPAVNFWVQGFDSAVHDFGKAGFIGHVLDGEAEIPKRLGGAAGG